MPCCCEGMRQIEQRPNKATTLTHKEVQVSSGIAQHNHLAGIPDSRAQQRRSAGVHCVRCRSRAPAHGIQQAEEALRRRHQQRAGEARQEAQRRGPAREGKLRERARSSAHVPNLHHRFRAEAPAAPGRHAGGDQQLAARVQREDGTRVRCQ